MAMGLAAGFRDQNVVCFQCPQASQLHEQPKCWKDWENNLTQDWRVVAEG